MKKTKAMKEREERANVRWVDEGGGYTSGIGRGFMGGAVAYIILPKGHPDIKKDKYDINVPVNGGLTYHEKDIFGWDFAHFRNEGTPEGDIKEALIFFRTRE